MPYRLSSLEAARKLWRKPQNLSPTSGDCLRIRRSCRRLLACSKAPLFVLANFGSRMQGLVGPSGTVVAMDIDDVKIAIAREGAAALNLPNLEFRTCNLCETEPTAEFDFVYARFLLTHLPDPCSLVAKIRQALRPGGTLVVADIDFRGYFSYPESPALARYVTLYTEAVKRRGGDPNIGPRLPTILTAAGFENVQMSVAQPAGLDGDVKLMSPLTMENIADAVMR